MAHPNEPSLAELKRIERSLIGVESTNENMQKLRAVGQQIKRKEGEAE